MSFLKIPLHQEDMEREISLCKVSGHFKSMAIQGQDLTNWPYQSISVGFLNYPFLIMLKG